MKTFRIEAAAAALIAASVAPAFSQSAIVKVQFTPTGMIDVIPTGISDDGKIVVGVGPYGAPNLLYTQAGGVSVIGDGCTSGLMTISGDGSTIVGCNVDANGSWNTAKWLGGTSWLDLGSEAGAVPCDVFLSGPWAVTQDGSMVTGLLWLSQICKAAAGTWDLVGGGPATKLPLLVPGSASRGNAISDNGTVIAGWQDDTFGSRRAAKWVNGVGEFITGPGIDFLGEALAISGDGRTIIGIGYNGGREAWVSREGEGIYPISSPADGDYVPLDLTDDGRMVIGLARDPVTGFSRAWVWSQGKGVSMLEDFLRQRRADVPAGWTFNVASVITPDGKTLYGWGVNPQGFIEMFRIDTGGGAPTITLQQK